MRDAPEPIKSSVTLLFCLNASLPIVVTELAIEIEVIVVIPSNALLPIESTESGMTKFVMLGFCWIKSKNGVSIIRNELKA
jgi:hypothetical protein